MKRKGLDRSSNSGRCTLFRGSAAPGISQDNDPGFTLIELLVTLTILPLVMGAISVGLISVFSLHSSVGNRLSNSADAQMVSADYVKDIQSSEMITTEPSSSPQCGTGTQLLGLQWDGGKTVVSYSISQTLQSSTTLYSLVRYYCTLGNTASPASTSTVSNNISATQAPPVVSCSPTATSCSASTEWIEASEVSSVTFAITEPSSNFSYSLTATPRTWNPASSGVGSGGIPYAPLTLLDPSSCSALRVGQGTLSVNVGNGTGNGILNIESTCSGSVTVSNGGTLAASSIVTADQGLDTIAPNSHATYPSTEYYSNQFTDPFESLAPPTAPSGPDETCTSSLTAEANGDKLTTYTCPSGVYASPPSFSGTDSVIVNFTGPGSYSFEQGLSIPNNVTVNFSSGAYIFDGETAFSTGNNVTMTGSNVLFYVGSGSASIGNNNSINLSALSGYDGITLWDAVDSGTVTVGDNTDIGINFSLGGGIYMPKASLTTGSNVTLDTTFLIADTAHFGNNVDMTISSP